MYHSINPVWKVEKLTDGMTEKDHAKRWHMRSGHTATEYFRTFKGRG
jgi:hypothetical protein